VAFQPQIPLAGPAGWRFLERTEPTQRAAFERGPALLRELEHFAGRVGSVGTAAGLVADRRLLAVALGAFGLEAEIDKRAFVRRVLESDLADPASFANRLTAPGWKDLARAFGFGPGAAPRTAEPGFAAGIAAAFRTRAFEAAVGESANDMRLAMNFRREIAALAAASEGGAGWFAVLGSKPLRTVLEKAYGLPSEFGRLDVDRQRDVLRDETAALFGTPDLAAFADPANVARTIDRFLARAQLDAGPAASAPGVAALTLLRSGAGGAGGSEGLFALLAARP
jgi:hypothetical protein